PSVKTAGVAHERGPYGEDVGALAMDPVVRDPREGVVGGSSFAAGLEKVAPGQAILGAGRVECARGPLLDEGDEPRAEVAHVDDLDGVRGRTGYEHLAAAIDADRP